MRIVINKHNVQIAAIAQFNTTQFSVSDDGQRWRFAVSRFQVFPTPLRCQAQHRFGQGAQVIGHLLNGQRAFNVTRKGAEGFSMMRPPQQVEQGLFILPAAFSGALQCVAPAVQVAFKINRAETFLQ